MEEIPGSQCDRLLELFGPIAAAAGAVAAAAAEAAVVATVPAADSALSQ